MNDRLVDLLRADLVAGRVVIVAGAGVSASATANAPAASWLGLIEEGIARSQNVVPGLPTGWADGVRSDLELGRQGHLDSLLSAAEKVTQAMGGRSGGEYRSWLRSMFENLNVVDDSVPAALMELASPIVTTNYDDVLDQVGRRPTVTWKDAAALQRVLRSDDCAIAHLHGHWRNPSSVVLGIQSYDAVLDSAAIQALQHGMVMMRSLLLVGVGKGACDPNLRALRQWLTATFPGSEYRHYRLCMECEVDTLAKEHTDERIVPLAYGASFEDLAPFLRDLGEPTRTSTPTLTPAVTEDRVWNLGGHRPDPDFAGRDDLLEGLHERFLSGTASAMTQVLQGGGGVGKTQLAVQYCHRYASAYDLTYWVRAETDATLVADFAGLTPLLGLPAITNASDATAAVRTELARRNRWLLVFDNAESAEAITDVLPERHAGHVLITSRHRNWTVGERVVVEVLASGVAVDYLCRRTGTREHNAAERLAEALGGLPLALAQATSVIVDGMSLDTYLSLIQTRAPELFREGHAHDYDRTVATTFGPSFDRAELASPAAIELLRLCAFVAPDAVPLDLIGAHPEHLPPHLREVVGDPIKLHSATSALVRVSLAETTAGVVSVHRLVQAVTRSQLGEEEGTWALVALQTTGAALPILPEEPGGWLAYEQLLAHSLAAVGHAARLSVGPEIVLGILNRLAGYFQARGRPKEAGAVLEIGAPLVSDLDGVHPAALAYGYALGRWNQNTGSLGEARRIHEDVYAARRRVFGEEDRETLASWRELLSTRYAQGERSELAGLQQVLVDTCRRVLGDDHPDTLMASANLAVALNGRGDYGGARHLLEQVLGERRRVLGDEHPDTLMTLGDLALTIQRQGDYTTARRLEEQVLADRRRLLGDDHPDTLRAIGNLAETLQSQGDYPGARRMKERVLEDRRRLLGNDHPDTLIAISNLASTLHAQGDYATARRLGEQVLGDRRRLLGNDHPDTLTSIGNLASMLHTQGDYAGARRLDEQVLADRRRLLGEDHPDTLWAIGNLASILHTQGDYAEARRLEEQVVEGRRRLLGPDHPDTLRAIGNLASTLDSQGDYDEARLLGEQVLAGRRRLLGEDHPDTLVAMANLASTMQNQGDHGEAQRLEEQVLDGRRRRLGDDHPDTLRAIGNVASTLQRQGEYAGAKVLRRQVFEDGRRLLGEDHPDTLVARAGLAATLTMPSEIPEARRLLTEGVVKSRHILGAHHSITTRLAWELAQLHYRTGNTNGLRHVMLQNLSWLRKTNTQMLSPTQRRIRSGLSSLQFRPSAR